MNKKRRLNILFSTTRQWNPGDEFILMGCINLLKPYISFNPVIYNRNPQIRYLIGWKRKFLNKLFLFIFRIPLFSPFVDNSVKPHTNGDWIDLVVFAGSPAWYGPPSFDLYQFIQKFKLPVIYLGIGVGEKVNYQSLKQYEQKVLASAHLITIRDQMGKSLLSSLKPTFKPCPALFSAPRTKQVEKVENIGLIFATHHGSSDNKIDKKTSKFLVHLFKILINENPSVKFQLVCHYIDELEIAYSLFPNLEILYSYDSNDYLSIYNKFDLVIGSRVHGLGISASLGIPGVMISHDIRSETVKGFLKDSKKSNFKI